MQVICHCYAVEKKRVVEAIQDGCSSVEEIRNRLGATGNCGACLPDVEALLDFYASFPVENRREPPSPSAPPQVPPG